MSGHSFVNGAGEGLQLPRTLPGDSTGRLGIAIVGLVAVSRVSCFSAAIRPSASARAVGSGDAAAQAPRRGSTCSPKSRT